MANETEWYWDLEKGIAVTAEDRGPGDHMLGPYASKGEAENWQQRVDQRNDAWDEADEEWEHAGLADDEEE